MSDPANLLPPSDPHRGNHSSFVAINIDPPVELILKDTSAANDVNPPPPPTRQDHHHHHDSSHCNTNRDSERDVDFDRDVLHRGVRDAGRWAYGTIVVEVWVWNELHTHLIRPPGGWWLDPVFHAHQHEQLSPSSAAVSSDHRSHHGGVTPHEECPLCRLTEPELATFEPPKPLAIGEGIPGVLWAELDHRQRGIQLVWRQVQGIADDPDQPYNSRLKLLAHTLVTKVGWAAAVPFDIQGSQGLVVYFARAGVSRERLQHPTNETYLVSAAHLIGSAYALRKPRQACVTLRREELQKTMARVKRKIRQMGKEAVLAKKMVTPLEMEPPEADESKLPNSLTTTATATTSCRDYAWWQFIESNTLRIWSKFAGGGVQPPPAFNWTQTAWTFVGVFSTLLILTRTNVHIVDSLGKDKSIVLGPFGALMTLMFGLTAAPASQPRNTILGQTLSMSIAIGISKLDLETWLQQSLATALAVTCMVKLGVTHPPAGAAALLFATGDNGWYNMLAVLLANLVAIAAATIINDINTERQYPTFWGVQDYIQRVQKQLKIRKDDREKDGKLA